MPIQTTYPFSHDVALAGQPYGMGLHEKITAFSNAVAHFGRGLVFNDAVGANSRPRVGYAAAAIANLSNFLGVAQYTHKQVTGDTPGLTTLVSPQVATYAIGDDITVVTKGKIWVVAETAVDLDDPVHITFNTTTGSGRILGAFRNASVASETTDLSAIARWAYRTTAAGIAVLELRP
ncbi:hypothetical protein [Thermoleptolyngbya sp. M55_K2018_002]|uniref:structural cement protein Gp24 n=1 Tax=Thermoleptolyngbya sp. M55_K2018_002 TaxID=2747808 RepID=UPI001A07AF39|nr:hypothetical protein [Thermoleptolyngbya sp. M55_K2018_002]HIK42167.1 hypothetical protein [Thermoleptolyngbya sp. M55_K2018_002]